MPLRLALEAFEKAAQEPEVMLEMAKNGLDSRAATKAFTHRRVLLLVIAPGEPFPAPAPRCHQLICDRGNRDPRWRGGLGCP